MEVYIEKFGYIGILLGTFFEGETTVLIGGILSKLGYMNIYKVFIFAFIGTFAGDFTFFSLGKAFGRNIVERYEFLSSKVPIADKIIKKHGNFIIFIIRFLVGIRAVVLLLLGCTNIKVSKFLFFSIANSILWSIVVSVIGYIFGNVVYIIVKDIKQYEWHIIGAIVIIILIIIFIYRHIMEKKERTYADR
ncbi:MAG TPA: DedA family protein [Syntrophorhabdaceae bacterium]|nr:DedA family protein [Syntrophorhabdaceae bacterium]